MNLAGRIMDSIVNNLRFESLLFILALFGFWVFAFLVIYHLLRFGVGVWPKRAAFIFLLGSIILNLAAVIVYGAMDFSNPFEFIQEWPRDL